MLTRSLKDLVAIGKLLEVDTGTSSLALRQGTRGVIASGEGMHVGVQRVSADVEISGLPVDWISVPLKVLNGALALIEDDEQLEVRLVPGHLMLVAGGKTLQVRLSTEITPYTFGGQFEQHADVDIDAFPSLVPVLSSVAARTVERPVMTGINLRVPASNQLLLRSTDGLRAFA